MSLLVVGSVAYDSVETPFGEAQETLGGSAVFFSASASFQAPVKLVGVVGEDFGADALDFLAARGVNLDGLTRAEGKTFRWKGRYGFDLNEAQTLATELNVFSAFAPQLNEAQRKAEVVFLANIHPKLQLDVLSQVERPKLVAADTMNYWIQSELPALLEVLKRVDMLVINESEARQLSGQSNTIKAAAKIAEMGPKVVVIKRGEYGSLMRVGESLFLAPAYPLEDVFDPTGAGDTFAGGLMGTLARAGGELTEQTLRRGVMIGSVLASFCVERFGVERMRALTWDEVTARYHHMKALTHFENLSA
jgi:sugar/nucleoside kinase (ribokinase family)